MIDDLVAVWERLPTWAKIAAGVTALLLIDAISMAWNERNFVAGVGEAFVAEFLRYAEPIALVAGGVFVGVHVYAKTRLMWFSWLCGIALALVGSFATGILLQDISGVSWRIDAMRNSNCYVDWDGRANPTVCE